LNNPHQHGVPFRFCPVCSGGLESRLLKAGEPERLVCISCDFVFYLDPKLAVGTVITDSDNRVALVKRAIELFAERRPGGSEKV